MLRRASKRVVRERLCNVELHREDAASFTPDRHVDVVIFSMSLSICSDPMAVFRHVLTSIPQGTPVIVADAMLTPEARWWANMWTRFKAPFVRSSVWRAEEIRRAAHTLLADAHERPLFGGLYTIVWGAVPERLALSAS
jgi:hypothetical protein